MLFFESVFCAERNNFPTGSGWARCGHASTLRLFLGHPRPLACRFCDAFVNTGPALVPMALGKVGKQLAGCLPRHDPHRERPTRLESFQRNPVFDAQEAHTLCSSSLVTTVRMQTASGPHLRHLPSCQQQQESKETGRFKLVSYAAQAQLESLLLFLAEDIKGSRRHFPASSTRSGFFLSYLISVFCF
jgi:hypothetical protein